MTIQLTEPQADFVFSEHSHPGFFGGFGCVHPATMVYTEYGLMRICDINRPMRVLSWNDQAKQFQLSLCSGAFPKGRGKLIRVVTQQGEFDAAEHHQIFSSDGTYSLVSSIRHGAHHPMMTYPPSSSLELAQILSRISVQNYSQKDVDYLGRYANEARQYGQQLLTEEERALFAAPSQGDAHTSCRSYAPPAFVHEDAQEGQTPEHIRHDQSCGQTHTPDFPSRFVRRVASVAGRTYSWCVERTFEIRKVLKQYLLRCAPRRIIAELIPRVLPRSLFSYSPLSQKRIISCVALEGEDIYYDMQVLGTNNYVCAAGVIHHNSGKSHSATLRLVHLITQDPGIDVSHFFPSYRLAKRRGLSGTRAHLKALGIEHTLNKSDLTLYLPRFGSTIYLETYHDPDAIVSFEVAHAVIDELDTLNRDEAELVWRKVAERTRQNCNHPSGNTLSCVTTPDQGTAGFCFETWGTGERIAEGYHYIKAGTRSNKFLQSGYADGIAKNYDPIMAEAYLDGGWVSFTANKVYHFFTRQRHHTDRRIGANDNVIHIGLDFNIGGCCAVAFVIDGLDPVAVDEFTSYDTRDFVHNLTRYKGKRVIVYPDASGRNGHTNASESDVSIIEKAGYVVMANESNPAVRDRVNAVNGLLSHERLTVNTNKCPNLTAALEAQGYTAKGEPEKWDKHPAHDDWADAFGYMIAYRFPVRGGTAGALRVSGGL